jgi:transcriptional regulator with XRE-family HTH domain
MITGAQIRMARGYLRWSAKQLGDRAGVAESTIKRMEQDEGFPVARGANIEAVYRTLTDAGIVFLEHDGGVGIRVRSGVARPRAAGKPPSRKQAKPARRPTRRRPTKPGN